VVSLAERRQLTRRARDYVAHPASAVVRPRRVALMARVSSAESRDNETIKPQIAFLEAQVAAYQLESTRDAERVTVADRLIDDGVSGAIPLRDRPDGRRLLSLVCPRGDLDCRGGCGGGGAQVDEVWAHKLDRVARRLELLTGIHGFLTAHEVRLLVFEPMIDTRDYFGRLLFHILAAIAEWERDIIAERTMMGRKAKCRDGKWKGGMLPLGLRTDADGYLILDERLIDVAQERVCDFVYGIGERVLNHVSTPARECERLTALGVPLALMPSPNDPNLLIAKPNRKTRADGVWRPNRMRELLHNTLLAGYGEVKFYERDQHGKKLREENGEFKVKEVVEYHPPAVFPEAMFDGIQQAIDDNGRFAKRHAQRTYLLTGLVRCGRPGCGYSWHGFTARQKGQSWSYYHCGSATQPAQEVAERPLCRSRSGVRADALEAAVWGAIDGFLRDPGPRLEEAQRQLEAKRSDEPQRLALLRQVRTRGSELANERERVEILFQRGQRSWDRTERELRRIDRDLSELNQQRAMLEATGRMIESARQRLASTAGIATEYRAMLDDLSDEQKRWILQRLNVQVEVFAGGAQWGAAVSLDAGEVLDVGIGLLATLSDNLNRSEGSDQPQLRDYRLWRVEQAQADAAAFDGTDPPLRLEVPLGPGAVPSAQGE
jgi:site-specific DNA recombinase